MTSQKRGEGGVPPKGDQKMTGGEGGYLQKVTSFMNKSIKELEGNLGFLCLLLLNTK